MPSPRYPYISPFLPIFFIFSASDRVGSRFLAQPHRDFAVFGVYADDYRPGYFAAASATRPGSSNAAVPIMTRQTPRSKPYIYILHCAHAAAKLHGNRHGFDYLRDCFTVGEFPGKCRVQVDDMQGFAPSLLPSKRHFRGSPYSVPAHIPHL